MANLNVAFREQWKIAKGNADEYAEALGVSKLIGKLLSARMTLEEAKDFLDENQAEPDPFLLKDMDRAVALVREHIENHSLIRIVGDYDVDGITATAILWLGLRSLGAEADFRIPERIGDGYGFGPGLAAGCVSDGVGLVVTCDNGIRQFDSAELLTDAGIDLIVTDHHDIEQITADGEKLDRLPRARAVINAHRADSAFPYRDICGAVTAYQLIRALGPIPKDLRDRMISYAALATNCDVMPLKGLNRRIVKEGLKIINDRPSAGLKALKEQGGIEQVTAGHLGFVIGPMLNAGGRLSSQNTYAKILLSDDERECQILARELAELNRERQAMTEAGMEEGTALALADDHPVKVLYLKDLHESIAGLVAGRVRERTNCPVFVVTASDEGLKGSGRSIPAYGMFEEMCKAEDLFTKFGGHPMAAGFSLKCQPGEEQQAVDNMRRRLNGLCTLTEEDLRPVVLIDAGIRMQDFGLTEIYQLECMEPFGAGNPSPLFAQKNLLLNKVRFLGEKGRVARLTFLSEGRPVEAVLFDKEKLEAVLSPQKMEEFRQSGYTDDPPALDVCYRPEINSFRGNISPQYVVSHMRPHQ